jgi:hypothetical protein
MQHFYVVEELPDWALRVLCLDPADLGEPVD